MATVSSLCLDRQCWRPLPGLIQRPQSWWWPSVLHWVLGPCCVCPGATLCSRGHCGRAELLAAGDLALPYTLMSRLRGLTEPVSLCSSSGRRPDIPLGRCPDPRSSLGALASGWGTEPGAARDSVRTQGRSPGKEPWAPRRHLPGHSSACAPSTLSWPGTCLLLCDARASSLFSQPGLEPLGALRPVDSQ